uniref:RNA-directed DNA polymerase n=1 Tax=Tenebrio molitor TaxID=7067 RepID=A0A8J6H3U2_TENMO|nr:hypothetical protein GEV33_015012 [Tenebrio molitor]
MEALRQQIETLKATVSTLQQERSNAEGDIAENFKFFQRSWENYLKASGLSKRANDEQIAVLMTAVGDEVFKRFPNFNIEDEDQQTAEKVLKAIGRNLTPQVNKRYKRVVFNLAKQEENEKYVDYFNRLRTLLKNCQYGTLEDDLLLDKIICSIKDTSLRERLWMDRNITLDQAIDKCKAKELSQQQLRNIEESHDEVKKFQKRTQDKNNSKNFREPNSKRQGKECKYCGYMHEPGKCPAKGVICKKCSKKDHYARVCYSKGKNTVKEIGREREENEEDILNITTRNPKQINTELDFIINDEIIKVSCQLDTGATCNVVGYEEFCKIVGSSSPKVEKSSTTLKCFSGKMVKPVGQATLKCLKHHKVYKIKFEIVSWKHRPLLSAEACEQLRLIKVCNKVEKLENEEAQEIINRYAEVFEGMGCIEDPLHLNQALRGCDYQMPTIEEILPELADARVFTTLDAKKGFWQLKLNDESSKLTSFWTPFGKYKYLRLPFGVKPAMQIYQKKQHEIVQGLRGTIAIADDILVYGKAIEDSESKVKQGKNKAMSKEGSTADPSKTTAIRDMEEPKNKAELLRFLGDPKTEEELEVYSITEDEVLSSIEEAKPLDGARMRDTTIEELKKATREDVVMTNLYNVINDGWPEHTSKVPDTLKTYWKYRDELTTHQGLILKGSKVVVPLELRKEMLKRLHRSHQGIENTTKLARDTVFWPNMNTQIKETVQSCEICTKYSRSQQNPPMLTHEIPTFPFQRVNMDVFELRTFEVDRNNITKRYLVTVDQYSDFFEIDELKHANTEYTIQLCKRNFSRYGIPTTVITDNGSNFTSEKFKRFTKEWNFQHITSSPNHQQGNGKAEAAVKIAKGLIKKSIETRSDVYKMLLHWRNTPNKMNSSPAQRMFSRRLRSDIPMIPSKLKPEAIADVPQAIQEQRNNSKRYYDRGSQNLLSPRKDSNVHFQKNPQSSTTWTPGKIKKQINSRTFEVENEGTTYRRSLVYIKTPDKAANSPEMRNTQDEVKQEEQTRTKATDPEQPLRRSTRQRRIPDKYSDVVVKAKGCYTDTSHRTPLDNPHMRAAPTDDAASQRPRQDKMADTASASS